MKTSSAATLIVAIACAAIVAGCGGDGSEDAGGDGYSVQAGTTMTVATPRLTKKQFVKRTNQICREAWVTVHDNWAQHTRGQDPAKGTGPRFEEAVRLSLLAGIDFHIFDSIRILGAPPGEQSRIEEIIGPFQAAVELGQQERWRARSIEDIPPHFSAYNSRARRYGLTDCLVDEAHLRGIRI